jgi:NADP-dependent 3-hydroxy acid dehydrogenase YdfG
MNKSKAVNPTGDFITATQAAESANIGIATAKKFAEQANAVVHIGRCYRIDRLKFLEYIANQN